ncbi:MAG: SDR family NAD(P)-dependent oxidoreductase [Muribaculaceae bacterium]|nr:SDR family NAD(P)-dependent oxidoreductase [Muribaculaceae bacterium]
MKRIVIIGASSGLGFQVARDFAAAGWRVGVAARREEPLKALKEAFPQNVEYATLDVTAPDAIERFNGLIELTDGMDVLLYAAGTGFYDPALGQPQIVQTLEVNCVGFARIVAEAYKYFRDTANVARGQIAAITSVAGTKGIGVSAAYSSSKRFQQMFIDSLDQLAHQQHVNVCFTDIRPGFVSTPLLAEGKDYPMLMPVEYAARLIERAVVRERRVAVIDTRWAVLTALWRMIPGYVWRRISIEF